MKSLSTGLIITGIIWWIFPGFNGLFNEPIDITEGENAILCTMLILFGILFWNQGKK